MVRAEIQQIKKLQEVELKFLVLFHKEERLLLDDFTFCFLLTIAYFNKKFRIKMAVLGIDLGGTKLAFCLLDNNGKILYRIRIELKEKKGKEVGSLITEEVLNFHNVASSLGEKIDSIGISVPGIYHLSTGTVWAPNIAGWDDYPLLDEVKKVSKEIPVTIDSDRACYILGEFWKGNAQNCKNAIFLAVGTGIGAGILIEGNVLRGANDIAGAIGWMALDRPFKDEYISCGCFEHYASGEGIVKQARYFLQNEKNIPVN